MGQQLCIKLDISNRIRATIDIDEDGRTLRAAVKAQRGSVHLGLIRLFMDRRNGDAPPADKALGHFFEEKEEGDEQRFEAMLPPRRTVQLTPDPKVNGDDLEINLGIGYILENRGSWLRYFQKGDKALRSSKAQALLRVLDSAV